MKRVLVLLACLAALLAPAAEAHPLGNFTTNRYSELVVSGDRLYVLTVLDLAEIPTFQEVLDLRERLSRKLRRPLGVYPETKHPTYFRSLGLPLEPALIRTLERNGLNRRGAPVFVQSFETGNLQAIDRWLDVPLVQLLGAPAATPVGDTRTYAELATPAGLRSIARYAEGVDESGEPIEVVDRHRDKVMEAARRYEEDELAFLRDRDFFGGLVDSEPFTTAYTAFLKSLHDNGARVTLEDLESNR